MQRADDTTICLRVLPSGAYLGDFCSLRLQRQYCPPFSSCCEISSSWSDATGRLPVGREEGQGKPRLNGSFEARGVLCNMQAVAEGGESRGWGRSQCFAALTLVLTSLQTPAAAQVCQHIEMRVQGCVYKSIIDYGYGTSPCDPSAICCFVRSLEVIEESRCLKPVGFRDHCEVHDNIVW